MTAYVIMGHGFGLSDKKIVPPGCTLVVQAKSGEKTYGVDTSFKNMFLAPDKSKFLDPITNYKSVYDTINENRGNESASLAIYKEGEEYTDFKYILLLKWDTGDKYTFLPSGVAKYPFDGINVSRETHDYTEYGRDIFKELYRHSVYPTKQQIKDAIDNSLPNKHKFSNIFAKPDPRGVPYLINIIGRDVLKSTIEITQSELFNLLEPGVFYNLVCRETRSSLILSPNKNGKRRIINRNIYSQGKLASYESKKEIYDAISEAVLHRKPFVPQLGLNRGTIGGRRHRRARRRTRKLR